VCDFLKCSFCCIVVLTFGMCDLWWLTRRPVTSASGRYVRLGTASLASGDPTVFIDTSKLDLQKYATRPSLARALFEYIMHVANDTLMVGHLHAACLPRWPVHCLSTSCTWSTTRL
jgi:hypothetical protein